MERLACFPADKKSMELTKKAIATGSEPRLFSLRIGLQALGEEDG